MSAQRYQNQIVMASEGNIIQGALRRHTEMSGSEFVGCVKTTVFFMELRKENLIIYFSAESCQQDGLFFNYI